MAKERIADLKRSVTLKLVELVNAQIKANAEAAEKLVERAPALQSQASPQ